jgi:hypothetical protein
MNEVLDYLIKYLCDHHTRLSETHYIKRVILTYALTANVKVPKNRNLIFNDTKSLMRKELNTP